MQTLTYTAVVLAAVLCLSPDAAAQDPLNSNPVTKLDNIKAASCTFPASARVNWPKDGTAPTATVRSGSPMTIRVQEIDSDSGTAVIMAPTKADASVQVYGWNLHVLEPSRSGRMLMLTIFGRESAGGKLKAAYTRTDYLPIELPGFVTEPEVVQYYGECEVTR